MTHKTPEPPLYAVDKESPEWLEFYDSFLKKLVGKRSPTAEVAAFMGWLEGQKKAKNDLKEDQ